MSTETCWYIVGKAASGLELRDWGINVQGIGWMEIVTTEADYPNIRKAIRDAGAKVVSIDPRGDWTVVKFKDTLTEGVQA